MASVNLISQHTMAAIQAVAVDPSNLQNLTSFHRNEIGWSSKTPAASLGRLDPPRDWHNLARVPHMKDPVTNRTILDTNGVPIPDYPFLPRYLSSNLEWFRVEAYFREHPDMSYYHIWQRQPIGTPVPTVKERNRMNNMRLRKARGPYNARCWARKGQYPPRILVELVEGLSQTQLLLNTTWIVKPRAIQQPGADRLLPLNVYLDGYPVHTPSAEVRAALAESHRLQALASSHHLSHWSDLPRNLLPNAWFGRARTQQARSVPQADTSSNDSSDKEGLDGRTETDEDTRSDDGDMPGNGEDGLGPSETDDFGEEGMRSKEKEGGEEDAEGEEEENYEVEVINEDEEGKAQDDSGAEGGTPFWRFEDIMGVAPMNEMDGGQLFQNTSDDILGMEGASGAAYNGFPVVRDTVDTLEIKLRQNDDYDTLWQPLPTTEATNYQHDPWYHQPADTIAGGSSGYVTEASGPSVGVPQDSSLLDNSHDFPEAFDTGILDPMLYGTPADGDFFSDFVNNNDERL